MANLNRQNPAPTPRPGQASADAAGLIRATQRGTVPIRRNVEDNGDPYLPTAQHPGTVICRECHAVHQVDRWSLDSAIYQEALKAGQVRYEVCPACRKRHDKQPGGIVTLTSEFIGPHREEILNLIRNEDTRAKNTNPLERIMEIEGEGNSLVVTTTNEKLAQRIGRAMRHAYKGHVEYRWRDSSKQARITWTR